MKKFLFAIIYLFFTVASIHSQQALELSGSAGVSLDDSQIKTLQDVAVSIQPNFKTGVSFNIYDCSFYTFNDEMGADQEAAVWEDFQKQASDLGENYLLMGRQITPGSPGFKLWIQLAVNPSDLECYDSEFDKEIQEKIEEYQVNLEEYYELLTINLQTNNFEIILKVAEQAEFDIRKTCCSLDAGRSECDLELGPYEIVDQQNLKYFIIGRLQCIFFGADGNCEDHCLNNTEDLYNLEASQFKVYPDSRYSKYDAIPEIGFCHIYFSEGTSDQINYNVDPVLDIRIERVQDENDSDGDGNIEEYILIEKPVDVYNLGMLTVVVDKGVKLYEKLEKINTDCNALLKDNNFLDEIDDFFVSDDALNTLLYSSYCNFDLLTDARKNTLLNVIVTVKTNNFLKFWKYFEAKYPLFVVQLYDSFESRLEFFRYQKKHIDFAVKLLKYDLPNNLKAPFLAQYCSDYKNNYATIEFDDSGEEYIRVDDQVIDEIVTIPYDVNETFSFYSPNYNFKLDGNTANVKITTGGHFRVVGGGAPLLTYIVYQPENYFESIDPFDPVFLTGIDLPNFEAIPKLVPGIILLAAQDFVDVENAVASIMLAADIAATVTLIGNASKLNYIGKLRLIFFSLEGAGLTGSLIVQYTNLVEDPELRIKLSLFFAAMEITGSIGSPDFATITKLQNRASQLATEVANSTKISNIEATKGLTKILSAIAGKTGILNRIEANLGTGHALYLHIFELDPAVDAVLLSKYAALSDDAIKGFEIISDIATCRILSQDLRLSEIGDEIITFFNGNLNGVKAWKVAKNIDWPSTNVDFLGVLSNRMNHPNFPLTETIIEDIVVRADILDETLGSNQVRSLVTDLIGDTKFVNHEDLLKNIDACFVNDVPNISKLNTQLNEFYEGQYWITRGEDVKISKELNPGQQYNNEVDGLLLTREGILECKYPSVPGANAQNNVYANLQLIIKKFTTESKLTQNWKDLYPKRYGQINIANGSFSDLASADEFVQAVKDAGIIGNEAGISLFTKAELQSLDELHIIVNNERFIINPADWD